MSFRDAQLDAIALARNAGGATPDGDAVEALIVPMSVEHLRLTLLAAARLLYAACSDLAAKQGCGVDDILNAMTGQVVAASAADDEDGGPPDAVE
ncbi:hypothetical protein ACPCIR_16750 [Mycobacterium sp. NPDC051198]